MKAFGPELRFRRLKAGMSLRDLAGLIHFDRGYLSRVERGQREPSWLMARQCDAALDANGELLRLAASGNGLQVSTPQASSQLGDHGRDDTTLGALINQISSAAADLASAANQPNSISVSNIASEARAAFDLLRRQGRTMPPRFLLPTLAAQFGTLCRLAKTARSPARELLLNLAAHYAEYAGWMAQESGDERASLNLTTTAERLAREAGEFRLAVYTLVRRADVALYRRRPLDVIALAEQAEADRSASVRVRALAAQRAAQGYALAGERERCVRALERAALAGISDGASEDEIPLGSTSLGRLTTAIEGWCFYDLGQPDRAVAALSNALAQVPHASRRARALYGARLAISRAANGDLELACADADDALTSARLVDSASTRHQLRNLEVLLRRWSSKPMIREIQAQINLELCAR